MLVSLGSIQRFLRTVAIRSASPKLYDPALATQLTSVVKYPNKSLNYGISPHPFQNTSTKRIQASALSQIKKKQITSDNTLSRITPIMLCKYVARTNHQITST